MTAEKKQEFTRRITQANKTQIITILYEMVLEYLAAARAAYARGDLADFDVEIVRAQECVNELIRSLHLEYGIAQNFLQLYLFAKRALVKAIARREVSELDAVERMMHRLHATYLELEKLDGSAAQMENTQVVYAGLTYGKGALNEDVSGMVMNRGYQA